ncbi:acetate kinase [Paenibacillus sacheonensis]|uniref:Acetate kinase n=1 Tax=Paenibacillus sacheonensis TaxID=742054 RepID=A0A7X4YMG6_9BACL|nr:acetate kinase [Paenibacillus sacheonensis]MBM7564536.1 acetate kinase [Paenibacillus sacheonensis]NBC69095.1 acetate/propionate family kinase [Paenibacillus sacheonensis]
MIILVMNAGSSSLKYQLYNMEDESVLAQGRVERIGMDASILVHEPAGKAEVNEVSEILDHNTAVRRLIDMITHKEHGVLESMKEIHAVGHRVVHGGESFKQSTIVTDDVKKEIRRLFDLAPLHNPPAMMGITAVEYNLPEVPQVVVFDTAFHQSMPQETFLYPIPMVLYRRHKIRRYGFHGTSHDYVSKLAAKTLGMPLESLKLVTCHIGNGASCAAIMNGRSFDTSMGLTPLEGLMMGTRSGDLDPAIVPFTMNKEELTLNEVNSMLNKHSGLLAISGIGSDMREIVEAMDAGDKQAKLAFDMYTYRLRKYIGAYAAGMNGLDAIVFTAGVGENSVAVRKAVCENLSFLGIELDDARNEVRSKEPRSITTDASRVKALVVPTNEELLIARDTDRLVKGIV